MRYDGIIELEGMEFHAYHGCLEKERREGNTFIVDFHAETELEKAVKTDELGKTIDYGRVYDIVRGRWPFHPICWRMSRGEFWMPSARNSMMFSF